MTSKGKVKFYSTDKGYGFIHDGESGKDVFFHITAVLGPNAPSTNDAVSFELAEKDRKGRVAASRVEIIEKAQTIQQQRSNPKLDGLARSCPIGWVFQFGKCDENQTRDQRHTSNSDIQGCAGKKVI
jgi:cold shock protein